MFSRLRSRALAALAVVTGAVAGVLLSAGAGQAGDLGTLLHTTPTGKKTRVDSPEIGHCYTVTGNGPFSPHHLAARPPRLAAQPRCAGLIAPLPAGRADHARFAAPRTDGR
ncbi:hypothetical protein [Streptomyces sp. NPDC048650]|uniref:hypothetical protein n=1 Tax=unclassified Streptomyces TaxID=2593676 RepID=UPI003715D916